MKLKALSRTALSLGTAVLTACAVGPDYHPPAPVVVDLRNTSSPLFVAHSPVAAWWRQFDDRELNSLVQRALAANPDLDVAAANVRAARAVFVGNEFDFAPHLPLETSYSHTHQQEPGFTAGTIDVERARLGLDASWEIDLFGHLRRSVQAARADLGARQADLRGAQVTVAAEVARNYFELRGTQRRLDVARRNRETQRKTLELTQARYSVGRSGRLDVERARARLQATAADIPPLEAAEKQYDYRLAVLLGLAPGALDDELQAAAVPAYAKALPIGDAAELLRRRPDVRAAERQLAAATARVGIATADLFPRVNVTGFVGFLSGDIGHLFNTSAPDDARAWSVTPTVSWAALDFGTLRARLRAARAGADAAAANYEKVVLAALEDMESSFVVYSRRQAELKLLQQEVDASRRATALAEVQYRVGAADFLTLLDAQRTQLQAQDAAAQAEAAANVAVVAIYKALGGVGMTGDI